ncbi:MAG: cell division transport system permease protein [Pseudonocardiales bacterium]|jgi:cell division transport system permease protein|nr:cell division transport system permease protein [Pseudonocardiales bacterium]MDT4951433.1 cell division transport system permease protein [Pseudonocardiales bacterium]
MRANFVMSGVYEGIRRNATMTIALILSTAIALAFAGAAILANTEISRFKHDYEGSLNVSVYLCTKVSRAPCTGQTTAAETQALQSKLAKDPRVSSVNYVSEAEQYQRATQIQGPEVAKLTNVGDLPASFTVKLKDVAKDYDQFAVTYAADVGVSAVKNPIGTIRTLLKFIDSARLFSIAIAIVVLVASILLISNTIQVAAAQRRNETSIMRLVGASRWMTELPFMLETVIATAIGGLVGFGLVALGKYYVLSSIFSRQVQNGVIPNLGINDVLVASGSALIVGIALSALTAFATLRLYVRL